MWTVTANYGTSNLDENPRGQLLSVELDESNFLVFNEQKPTRMTKTTQSSPDISLSTLEPSEEYRLGCREGTRFWSETHNAEVHLRYHHHHYPHRTFINFRKADWKVFTEETERRFEKTKRLKTVQEAEKTFGRSTTIAAGRHMPQSCIRTLLPNFPTETAELAKQRD